MKKLCLILIGMFLLNFISLSSVSAISIITHIPEKYQEVYPGERLYFEIEVKYPENPTRVDLRLNYIIEKDGQTVAQSKALKAVETQASFMDFLILPEDAEVSLHDLRIEVRDYGDLDEEVATSFKLSKKGLDRIAIYFFIVVGIFGILGILIMIDIFRRRK